MRLNADLGEHCNHGESADELLMPHIHQANIACGFHAGNADTMRRTLQLAKKYGVEVGAHPSYPDLENFGRKSIDCTSEEIKALVGFQLNSLSQHAEKIGLHISYLKPHGALYHDMMSESAIFTAVLQAATEFNSHLPLMVGAHCSETFDVLAKQHKIPLWREAFADRRYTDDGSLQPRSESGAVLSAEQSLQQAAQLCETATVTTDSGKVLSIKADSLCVHGDNPESIAVVEQIRRQVDGCV